MESFRAVRGLVAAALLLLPATLGAADATTKHLLKPEIRPGDITRVDVSLQVGGDLKLVNEGVQKLLPMSVVANLSYDEKLLAAGARSVRYYHEARAVIKVDKGGEKPNLPETKRLIGVEKPAKGAAVIYCPTAALQREELDLIDVPGNTLVVNGLLPIEAVAVGQSWKHSDQTLADLLGLEAVSWTDVQSVLGQIIDGSAEVAAAGSVSGAVGGVATEIELKAKYKFDLKNKRITYLALLIKEKRVVGHIGPGLDTVAKLIVKIESSPSSEHLSAAALKDIPLTLVPALTRLSYAPAASQFRLSYDRGWYLTTDEPKLAVFRLLDRGELVAQCNISALPGTQKKPVSLAEFQQDVQQTLGKSFGQFANASQTTNEAGYQVLRLVAHGTVSQLPIEWIYYLISDGHGQRVSLSFTLEQSLTERFAETDRVVVSGLRLLEAPLPTAARPSQNK